MILNCSLLYIYILCFWKKKKCCSKAGAQRLRIELFCYVVNLTFKTNTHKKNHEYFRDACDWGFVFVLLFHSFICSKTRFLQFLRNSTSTSPYEESQIRRTRPEQVCDATKRTFIFGRNVPALTSGLQVALLLANCPVKMF